jgi:hypothetical protein
MSKRNRPTTAAQATHRLRRHLRRSELNSPENKAARAAKAGGKAPAAAPAPAAKPAPAKPTTAKPTTKA